MKLAATVVAMIWSHYSVKRGEIIARIFSQEGEMTGHNSRRLFEDHFLCILIISISNSHVESTMYSIEDEVLSAARRTSLACQDRSTTAIKFICRHLTHNFSHYIRRNSQSVVPGRSNVRARTASTTVREKK